MGYKLTSLQKQTCFFVKDSHVLIMKIRSQIKIELIWKVVLGKIELSISIQQFTDIFVLCLGKIL